MSDTLLQGAPQSDAGNPEWFITAQNAAAARFETLPMPSRQNESWRFSNLKALDPLDFTPARPVVSEVADQLRANFDGIKHSSATLSFANDRLIHRAAEATLAEQGVLWLPLDEALRTHPDLVHRYFMRSESAVGTPKFLAHHQASVRTGTFLYVPKGVRLTAPLQTVHWAVGSGQAIFPHTLIVAEEESAVTFLDWFKSGDEGRNLACGVTDLHVGPNASVHYISVQDWNRQTVAQHSNTTAVAHGGSALHLGLHLGGVFARSESVSHLNGVGARSEMLAATVADGAQEFDQRTFQDHRSPDTWSDLLYKNALYNTAKTIVSGLIRVEPHAHRTDAYQKVRNLVLSTEAEANSLPGLEILADQVRCSHGATTGEINPEELFYMQSRGIPEKDAYRLITFGFLNEVLERLPDEPIRLALQDALRTRLQGH
jgi:Fe-S cluster assembly protein SufD